MHGFFSFLQDAAVTLDLNRFASFTNKKEYLDHGIRPGPFEVANVTIDAIHEFK